MDARAGDQRSWLIPPAPGHPLGILPPGAAASPPANPDLCAAPQRERVHLSNRPCHGHGGHGGQGLTSKTTPIGQRRGRVEPRARRRITYGRRRKDWNEAMVRQIMAGKNVMAKSNPQPIGLGFGSANIPNFERRMIAKRGPQPSTTKTNPIFAQRFDRKDFRIDMGWRLSNQAHRPRLHWALSRAEEAGG